MIFFTQGVYVYVYVYVCALFYRCGHSAYSLTHSPPQLSIAAQLTFQSQSSTVTVTKNCTLVAMPPVSQVNVTAPKPQWIVAGPQAVLFLDVQLYWTPPLANVTSYDVWVGAQPFSSSRGVLGKVQSFQVQYCRHFRYSTVDISGTVL